MSKRRRLRLKKSERIKSPEFANWLRIAREHPCPSCHGKRVPCEICHGTRIDPEVAEWEPSDAYGDDIRGRER